MEDRDWNAAIQPLLTAINWACPNKTTQRSVTLTLHALEEASVTPKARFQLLASLLYIGMTYNKWITLEDIHDILQNIED